MPGDFKRDFRDVIRIVDGRQFKGLRAALLAAVALQAVAWLVLFFYIDRNANPKGDGLEWIAMVPATFLVLIFGAPVLLLGLVNRLLTIGAVLAGASIVVGAVYYISIAREFAAIAARTH